MKKGDKYKYEHRRQKQILTQETNMNINTGDKYRYKHRTLIHIYLQTNTNKNTVDRYKYKQRRQAQL